MVDCVCVFVCVFPRVRLESLARREAKPTRESRYDMGGEVHLFLSCTYIDIHSSQ